MLIALAVVCLALLIAGSLASFALHLEFKAEPESLEVSTEANFRGCYDNWGAHRACPQSLPVNDAARR